MNINFAKLDGQRIEYAPDSGKVGQIFFSKLNEQQYRQLGYKPVVNNIPDPDEGYQIRFIKYTEDEDNIYFNYDQIPIEKPQDEKFEISKIFLKIALIKIGLWEMFDNWMQSQQIDLGDGMSMTVKDAWDECLVLDINSELFGPYINQAKEAFSQYVSSEQIDKIFEECRAK